MKAIFLDIDGVMHDEKWWETDVHNKTFIYPTSRYLCDRQVKLLNKIIDETGAKIILSSSHRTDPINDLQNAFKESKIKYSIFDVTPKLYFGNKNYDYSVPRGCEIKAWLELNKNILGCKISKFKYVILDDDTDMLYWQRKSFFKIDSYYGLTNEIANNIINYLNS